LNWQLDAKLHLQSKKLGDAIKEGNKMNPEEKATALIFLRHHIHDDLKNEYLTEEDPLNLWNSLKDRYDHQKMVILPNARSEWLNLRYQDYKTVSEYNSALFNIVARLKLCGETVTEAQKLEKTLSTFHATNLLLQQQYRERNFTLYSELVTCLLVAEENTKVLIKNHNARPTGAMAFPEANTNFGYTKGRGRGRGRNENPETPEEVATPKEVEISKEVVIIINLTEVVIIMLVHTEAQISRIKGNGMLPRAITTTLLDHVTFVLGVDKTDIGRVIVVPLDK